MKCVGASAASGTSLLPGVMLGAPSKAGVALDALASFLGGGGGFPACVCGSTCASIVCPGSILALPSK
eukprot:scaffold9935_cov20-Tisochrysis_lutea.AAC.2